jgi:hypothetical protein
MPKMLSLRNTGPVLGTQRLDGPADFVEREPVAARPQLVAVAVADIDEEAGFTAVPAKNVSSI